MTIYPSTIKGSVKISGSKNASLPIIAASLVTSKKTILKNIPNIKDIESYLKILKHINCGYKFKNNKLNIISSPEEVDLLFEEIKSIRASYYLMSVFLILFGKVNISYPGGCSIGSRPIDFHLEGFKAAGCVVSCDEKMVSIKVKKLKPFIYKMPRKSLGATVNLMILASKIEGRSIIENASTEPEIDDLICFLNKGNSQIYRIKNDIIIFGSCDFKHQIKHKIIPDRIEAFTYICIGVNSKKLTVKNIDLGHLRVPIKYLKMANVDIKEKKNKVIIKNSKLKNIDVFSSDYPMLSTDQMPLLYPLFLRCEGVSNFTEGIFNGRFDVCNELIKIGGDILVEDKKIIIKNSKIFGGHLFANDLRGAACLLIEGIINQRSTIHNLNYLERGYDSVYKKLKKIGLNFKLE